MLSVPTVIDSAGFEVLAPGSWGAEMLIPGYIVGDPLNQKVQLPPGHLGLHMPADQQVKKGLPSLAGTLDPDDSETHLLMCVGGRKERTHWFASLGFFVER